MFLFGETRGLFPFLPPSFSLYRALRWRSGQAFLWILQWVESPPSQSHTPAMCYRLTGAAVLWQIFVTSMAVNWCVWILVCPRQWIIFLLFFHIPALKLKLKYPAGNSHAVWFSSHTCCANPGQTAEQKAKDLPATYLILTRIQPALIPPVRFLEIFKKEFWSVSQLL